MLKKITSTSNSTQVRKSRGYSKIFNTSWSMVLLLLTLAIGCKKDNFNALEGVCPVVITDPVDKAVDVVLSKVITATFNTPMDATTITKTSFTISKGGVLVPGKIAATADEAVYTFTPDSPLSPYTVYTGTITTAAADKFRTGLENDYIWTFTTIPEIITSSKPTIGGTTTGTGNFTQGSATSVTATPNIGFVFTNWTEGTTVVSTSSNYSFVVNGNRALLANFSVVVAGNFAVVLSSKPINGGITSGAGSYIAGSSATIKATANAGYIFSSWSGDAAGSTNPLTITVDGNKNIIANFTPGVAIGPGSVNLGLAGNYNILTKAGISTTGVTTIEGDLGVSPSAATALTGFGLIMDASGKFSHTPIVTGKVYAADYAAPTPSNLTTAINDMETAYTTANGLISPAPIVELYAGNISGRTLAPGLYKWGTGVLISGAGVTLSGGPNDTWVFQIAQGLTVENSAIITLTGGAQAKNIVWVVASGASLGSNVDFSGIILSKTLISVNANSKVKGRLLAQTAVTLIADTIVLP